MSRTKPLHLVWHLLLPLMAVLAAAPPAWAQALTLSEAKQRGWIGEQSDGYVGIVTPSDPPPAARELVRRINAGRTEVYAKIAIEEGISVVAVAARSGERLIAETASGEWIWENGGWKQRGS